MFDLFIHDREGITLILILLDAKQPRISQSFNIDSSLVDILTLRKAVMAFIVCLLGVCLPYQSEFMTTKL